MMVWMLWQAAFAVELVPTHEAAWRPDVTPTCDQHEPTPSAPLQIRRWPADLAASKIDGWPARRVALVAPPEWIRLGWRGPSRLARPMFVRSERPSLEAHSDDGCAFGLARHRDELPRWRLSVAQHEPELSELRFDVSLLEHQKNRWKGARYPERVLDPDVW
ncbi:MAG: hypothetical protein AAGA48_15745 [Myxococcota bacterium]